LRACECASVSQIVLLHTYTQKRMLEGRGISTLTLISKTDEICFISKASGLLSCVPEKVLLYHAPPSSIKLCYIAGCWGRNPGPGRVTLRRVLVYLQPTHQFKQPPQLASALKTSEVPSRLLPPTDRRLAAQQHQTNGPAARGGTGDHTSKDGPLGTAPCLQSTTARSRTLSATERMLGRTRSACEEGDAVTRPVMLKVATYNKQGQHMEKRAYANADDGYGTGRDLVTKPGQGLRTALELAANQKIDVYVSVETRT
jgi:hypothetical protein